MPEWIKEKILSYTGKINGMERLGNALCNRVYCLDAENGRYIVKIAGGEKRKKELSNEATVMKFLQNQIDVPEVFLYREATEIACLLMAYIDGTDFQSVLGHGELDKTNFLYDLGQTLRKIHNVKLPREYRYQDVMERFISQAEMNMADGLLDPDEFVIGGVFTGARELLNVLAAQEMEETEVCLLHGDFRPKNVIFNPKCVVIDWGFCTVGDPYYDLAMILYYFDKQEQAAFLDGYGIRNLDDARLTYFENMSRFINV